MIALLVSVWIAVAGSAAIEPGRDQDLFNQGKVAMFDKKWEDARGMFQRVVQEFPRSPLVPQASYFAARCLQQQSKEAEALKAYEQFLQKYPEEPFLPSEARNAVVDLAVTLSEKGDGSYKDRVLRALTDSSKQVRYFAAIRASYLTSDRKITSLATPILREIVKAEQERELVDRAKIALLRIDPNALSQHSGSDRNDAGAGTRMFHILIQEPGAKEPTVELNLPLSLAELALAALSNSQKGELRRKGFDVDNVWESLKRMGRSDILTIRDHETIVRIWIE